MKTMNRSRKMVWVIFNAAGNEVARNTKKFIAAAAAREIGGYFVRYVAQ